MGQKNRSSIPVLLCGLLAVLLPSLGPVHAQRLLPGGSSGSNVPATQRQEPAQPKVYSRDRVFDVIRSRNLARAERLTLVAAHRGYWETYPENSWEAIREAGTVRGFEIVEADIKPTGEGLPVVFHDLYLNRGTNNQSTTHDELKEITVNQFIALRLRDRFGVTTDISPKTFDNLLVSYTLELLDQIRLQGGVYTPDNRPGFVLALDVKGEQPSDAWPLVENIYSQIYSMNNMMKRMTKKENLLTNAILIKIAAESLPDVSVVRNLVANAPDNLLNLCIVVDTKGKDGALAEKIDAAVKNYKHEPYVSTFEVVYKAPGDQDEHYMLDSSISTTIGNFLVYYDYPNGVGTSKAHCCSALRTDTYADDSIDYRGRWGWMARREIYVGDSKPYPAFSILTMDRPDLLIDYLTHIDRRNTGYIEYRLDDH